MKSNIIKLNPDSLEEEIEYALEENRKGNISDFAMVFYGPPKEEAYTGSVTYYWFGNSIQVLGLLQRLRRIVDVWIEENEGG